MKAAWLFSRNTDLAAFGGSFLLSLAALGLGAAFGILHDDTPGWAWVPAVILCDVAHVWATAFRTYLDPKERAARRTLFTVVPIVGLAAGIALYAVGESVFWRSLAYVAIFHFVRQQYGWVALYRARAGERGRAGRVIDTAAIYAATLYPLLYWHTHLPRRFAWFVPGDVVSLPAWILPAAGAVAIVSATAYVARSILSWIRGRPNPGKDLVVVTTAIAWYVGIVAFDSDYAFTVTNVFMHGIPYFVLVYAHGRRSGRSTEAGTARSPKNAPSHALVYVAVLWAIAFFEELLWDRSVWHDRAWLFGEGWDTGALKLVIVPMLALPQLTHYVLDGFVWKRRSNPSVASFVGAAPESKLEPA